MEISQIYVSVDDVREHLNEWMGMTPQKLVNVANKSPQAFSRFLTSHLAVVKFLPRRNPQTWQLFTRKTKKKLVKNYRPISLLQIVCKVLEQCAFNRFLSSLMTQSPLYNTQLLSVLHTMRQSLDKNIQMDVFYLDFAKAFDTVYHLNQQEWVDST